MDPKQAEAPAVRGQTNNPKMKELGYSFGETEEEPSGREAQSPTRLLSFKTPGGMSWGRLEESADNNGIAIRTSHDKLNRCINLP
jgi:hypothetical protein